MLKEHWDNIFIYSDMQAGHGGLYGTPDGQREYQSKGFATFKGSSYIDVVKLIDWYRKEVNPKVNVWNAKYKTKQIGKCLINEEQFRNYQSTNYQYFRRQSNRKC